MYSLQFKILLSRFLRRHSIEIPIETFFELVTLTFGLTLTYDIDLQT